MRREAERLAEMDLERRKEVGQRIKDLRQAKRVPQHAVADALNVTLRAEQAWEGGESAPAYDNLEKLAAYFKVSEDYILNGEEAVDPDLPDQMDRIEAKLDAIMDHLGISLSEDPAAAVERELEAAAAEQGAADRTSQQRSGSSASGEPSRRRAARAR